MKNDEVSDSKLRPVFKEWVLETNLDPKQIFAVAAKFGMYTKQRSKELKNDQLHPNPTKTARTPEAPLATSQPELHQSTAAKFQKTHTQQNTWTADKRETAWSNNEQSWRHEHKWKHTDWEKQDSAWTNSSWHENRYSASSSASSSSWRHAPTTQQSSSSSSWQHSTQSQEENQTWKRQVTLLPNNHTSKKQEEKNTEDSNSKWTPSLKRSRSSHNTETRPTEDSRHKNWSKDW